MFVEHVQRWRQRRSRYRPAGELIDTGAYEIASIPDDTTAKDFVLEHHYSGSFPSAKQRFGLYRSDDLVGVAVFSTPQNPRTLDVLPGGRKTGVELGRLVLLDDVAGNGETWFLARCFEQLRALGYVGVVSFSDPVPRPDASGVIVFPGHVGTIYQAHNAAYLGRTKSERKRLLADGTVFPNRTLAKIKKREKGWRYGVERLVSYGAGGLGERGDPRAWLDLWLPKITRPLEHGGNLKYAWALHGRDRKRLPPSEPYLKIGEIRGVA